MKTAFIILLIVFFAAAWLYVHAMGKYGEKIWKSIAWASMGVSMLSFIGLFIIVAQFLIV